VVALLLSTIIKHKPVKRVFITNILRVAIIFHTASFVELLNEAFVNIDLDD
jgi:hypothetical protein